MSLGRSLRLTLRLLALLIVVFMHLSMIFMVAKRGSGEIGLLLLYYAVAAAVCIGCYRLIDRFSRRDLVPMLKWLVLSFFFVPLWFFWGFIPLPLAFAMKFPTGSAALLVFFVSLVWVPLGAVLLWLSSPFWKFSRVRKTAEMK
jgi:hypothetical protein